jgi:hypothetical protein
MFLFTAQKVLAQRSSETTGGTIFDLLVDPNAQGNKVKGTIIIVYQNIAEDTACAELGGFGATMYPLLRVGTGGELRAFTDSAHKICYFDFDKQIKIFQNFISDDVANARFCPSGSSCPHKYWKLKSIQNAYDFVSEDGVRGVFLADVVIVVNK